MVCGAVTVTNWSAVVTGVLLAFQFPATIPWWIVVIALWRSPSPRATFGGLGKKPFNPAPGGVFLLIAYSVQMTTFLMPVNVRLTPCRAPRRWLP